jgi:hypothetical protein
MDSKGWEGEIHCWANECYNDGKGVQETRTDYVRFIQKHSSISKYEYGWIDEQWNNGTIKADGDVEAIQKQTQTSSLENAFIKLTR